jgi:DNA-directed RNA polymerase specialized sigma24 family protein
MVDQNTFAWDGAKVGHKNDRAHFLAMMSRIMRCVLLDRARRRNASKRPARARTVSLDEVSVASNETSMEQRLATQQALDTLRRNNHISASLVGLRVLGGLTGRESA